MMTSHSRRRMRRCSREMVWKRELTVICCQELTLIFSRNDNYQIRYTADEMSYRKTFAGFLFKMKFWLSSVCSFQVTNKFMEIAGNRWFKNCIMILGTIFCMLFKPQFRREELQHTERKCVRHLKLTSTLCTIIRAIIYHESLTSADEWLMRIVSESSSWN